jgi:CysZ protein
VGLVRGFLAPFRGGAFIARHGLWHYLVLPILFNLGLGAATIFYVQRYLREESYVATPMANTPVVGWLILIGLTVLASAIIFLILQPVLTAVFCDRLSERVERGLNGSAPKAPFLASTGRAIVHGILKAVLYGIAVAVGFFLFGFGLGVGSLFGVALGGLFIAYDGFDYPLSRRGASFGKKWAYLARHPGQTIGFGIGATLLYLVPLAFFVAPPFVAAGATMVFVESEGDDKVDKQGSGQGTPRSTQGSTQGSSEGSTQSSTPGSTPA